MALTPQLKSGPEAALRGSEPARQTSRTWRIDWEKGRVGGMTDGKEAVRQAVFMILQTERFEHRIFSWAYGAEMRDLIGKSKEAVSSELKRVISEALLSDSRIIEVRDFQVEFRDSRRAAASFTVVTVEGELPARMEVTAG